MRLQDFLRHPLIHSAFTNVGVDDHHDRPENIEVGNTSLVCSPAPGGPNDWDVSVPLEASVILFHFRGVVTTAEGGGKCGVIGVATRSSLEASTVSFGGHASIASGSYNAIYSKKAAAMNLSDKVFSSVGNNIALQEAYLTLTGPSTRVFRTTWQNYGFAYSILNVWGEIGVIG